ncbi:PstS family phosphate ABC transporter substrate-binding protein [Microseira wollei]|uniref:Phosphate-binding protein n=1 Tax=Microseira wollei NIES-4236 TaxID=2530354 RepID=A0AAV3XPT8_9CYAN|nr:PstS family phosphate ABC transporter substrate-binding protein [Microseira wollei]GET43940.1 phosphate binding protein [Microseira wollei NIES-4236]
MNVTAKPLLFALGILALTTSCSTPTNSNTTLVAAGGTAQTIKIDGSSTVFPITDAIAKEYKKTKQNKVEIQAAFSGTSGGFRKFCAGETDISDASRPINAEEMKACNQAGVRFIELPVAFDALTVVVNPQNTWAQDITRAELKKLWEPAAEGKITKWNQIRSSWPDRPINLYGAGKDSGTFDYFTEATVGQPKASRNDYTASEDDNVLVQGVAKDPNALGYFGFGYFEDNQDKLKALAIDNGKGAILPSRETVEKAQYQPLARPLFIYVNVRYNQMKPELREFVKFYLNNAKRIVENANYIPLPEEGYHISKIHFESGKVGTVFEGKSELNLTIGELLRKEKKF